MVGAETVGRPFDRSRQALSGVAVLFGDLLSFFVHTTCIQVVDN